MIRYPPFTGLVVLALMACTTGPPGNDASVSATIPAGNLLAGEIVTDRDGTPPSAGPGMCWDDETTPAVIETVTEQEQVTPAVLAADGSVLEPASFQTRTQQRIVADRRAVWFRVPCPEMFDVAFVETLQRALKVRGIYRDPVTGQFDPATSEAVRRYQAPQGLDSSTLSLEAARQLGLVAIDRADLK